MKYSYSWLKEYVPQIPEPEKLVELLTMRAFEVDSCEKSGNDFILDIKVLPNRAFDCLSHIGMAREIAAIINSKFQISNFKLNEDKNLKIKDFLSVEVQDKKLCPRYSARVVVDVKVGESPQWLKDKLITCGLRPINNIVDITNYVMLETGQPMHAFDLDKLDSRDANIQMYANDTNVKTIIVRRAKTNEKITTLDEGNSERTLNENILIIADNEKPIAIAGIKGGKGTEIDAKTSRVALEAANFEPANIRKSSKLLNLRTDASVRFENGLDINLTVEALNMAAGTIADLANGKIVSGIADMAEVKPRKISTAVTHSYVESLLGIKIKQKDILDILKRLDLPVKTIKKKGDVFFEVLVPSRRNDLNASEDLIEEIGRLYGYENISTEMLTSVLIPAVKNEELINKEKARNIFVGAGYSEVYNYSLVSEKDKDLFGFEMAGPRYPLSQDQKYLRSTLIIRLLENVKENLKYFDDVRIFEIGKVFRVKEKNIEEKRMIAGVLSRGGKGEKNLFYELKGVADLLLEKMGVADFWYDEHIEIAGSPVCKKAAIFDVSKRAKVLVGDKEIGWIGEINKNILASKEIDSLVTVFELDFDILNELIEEKIEYKPPSKYPAIIRDLSVLTGANTKIDDVLEIIENMGGSLLENVDLFDVYEPSFTLQDEGLRKGKQEENKSLSFRLVFQSYEKNLTDAEVNKLMEKIIKAVEEEGWEIRR
jgi:phenylalanyl-tRNA synthetase beta chain